MDASYELISVLAPSPLGEGRASGAPWGESLGKGDMGRRRGERNDKG